MSTTFCCPDQAAFKIAIRVPSPGPTSIMVRSYPIFM